MKMVFLKTPVISESGKDSPSFTFDGIRMFPHSPEIFGKPAEAVVPAGWVELAPIKVLSSAIFSHVPPYNPAGSTSDVDKKIQLFT